MDAEPILRKERVQYIHALISINEPIITIHPIIARYFTPLNFLLIYHSRKLRRFWKKRLNFSFLPILEVYKLSAFSRLRIRHSPMRMRMRLVSLKRAPLLTSDLGCKHSTSKRPTQFPPVSNLQIFIYLSFPLEELRSDGKFTKAICLGRSVRTSDRWSQRPSYLRTLKSSHLLQQLTGKRKTFVYTARTAWDA